MAEGEHTEVSTIELVSETKSQNISFINLFLDFREAKTYPHCPRLAILGSDALLFFLSPSKKVNSQGNGQFI